MKIWWIHSNEYNELQKMSVANLTNPQEFYGDGMDSVVIRHYVAGIKGGRTLDTTGFAPSAVEAGHLVIFDPDTEVYKPMPIAADGKSFGTLPSNHKYVGVVVNSVPASRAMVGIMYNGEVNDLAMPYKMDSAMKAAVLKDVPHLTFMHD